MTLPGFGAREPFLPRCNFPNRRVSLPANQLPTPMIHIISSIIVGFIVGLLARAVVPGMQHYGFWMTALLGIAGSFMGGLLGRLFSKPAEGSSFHPAGFLMSISGRWC